MKPSNSGKRISRVARGGSGSDWFWQKRIALDTQDAWVARLGSLGFPSWSVTERPDRVRVLLSVLAPPAEAVLLTKKFGGRVVEIRRETWLKQPPSAPIWIGRRFVVVDGARRAKSPDDLPRLQVPHGIAFGSGEHATTGMLLRAMAAQPDWEKLSVLDLGTGSGILALAARLLGARRILATDFDPHSIRTAAENEKLNFSGSSIRWQCADVKRLRAKGRHDIILANLFSGILCAAAPQISVALAAGGQLWLSGVLRSQEREVRAAYARRKLRWVRTVRRGKWVMLQWRKAG
jgi:ribosomal protein L11 methyltransferase